jgi:hypothetical protein
MPAPSAAYAERPARAARQDVGGGRPVAVEGELPLWGMQIDVAAAAEEVRAVGRDDGAKPLDDFLGSVGLGALGEQLKDLRLSAPAPAPAVAARAGAGAAPGHA